MLRGLKALFPSVNNFTFAQQTMLWGQFSGTDKQLYLTRVDPRGELLRS